MSIVNLIKEGFGAVGTTALLLTGGLAIAEAPPAAAPHPVVSDFKINNNLYAGHYMYLGPLSGINQYFVFSAMVLSSEFTSAQMLRAAEVAMTYCTVHRRQSSISYTRYGQLVTLASGKIYFLNISGTSAASPPNDSAITTAGQVLYENEGVPGWAIWEYTGITVPTTWDLFLIDIGAALSPTQLLRPDSTDAYVGALIAAVAKASPSAEYLNADSGIPGYTRIQLLQAMAEANITQQLRPGVVLPYVFQDATSGAGDPYDISFLADSCEAYTGLLGLIEMLTTVGETVAADDVADIAADMRLAILDLYDPASQRFRTHYGQTGFETLTGDAAFVTNLRFHIWPAMHGLLEPGQLATYRDGVIAYTIANTPLIFDDLVDDFPMMEWYWTVANITGGTYAYPAYIEGLTRFEARLVNRRTLTDVALYSELYVLDLIEPPPPPNEVRPFTLKIQGWNLIINDGGNM